MAFKIYGNKTESSKSLCETCRHKRERHHIDGTVLRQCGLVCDEHGNKEWRNIPEPVVKCSLYWDTNTTSIHEYNQQAWLMVSDRGKIRFVSPAELMGLQEEGIFKKKVKVLGKDIH